jgi:hypothetical protein
MSAPSRSPHRRWRAWTTNVDAIEVIEAILLSLATVVTAWSAYQAALWDGEQSKLYTKASAARSDATRLADEANVWRRTNTTGCPRVAVQHAGVPRARA